MTPVRPKRAASTRRFWLVKSEPTTFSFDHLLREPAGTTGWNGVRNYQARNFMRDDMRVGDGVLFYHSNCEPPIVAGVAEVASAAYADPTQFDEASDYFDPKATRDAPIWMQVDIRAVHRLATPVTLAQLRAEPKVATMEILRRGSRLSVTAVTAAEWEAVLRLGGRG